MAAGVVAAHADPLRFPVDGAEMPHGGFKQSGYGKDLSTYSLEDYTQIKHVMAKLDAPANG